MAVSNSAGTWTLQMLAGSVQNVTFTLLQTFATSTVPWPISGFTWEYVVRQTDLPGAALVFELTTSVSASGLLTITSTASLSSVLLTIYPAATSALQPGSYSHALWSNPGTTSAYAWFTGQLIVTGNPQP